MNDRARLAFASVAVLTAAVTSAALSAACSSSDATNPGTVNVGDSGFGTGDGTGTNGGDGGSAIGFGDDAGGNGGGGTGTTTGDGGAGGATLTADQYVAQYCALYDSCCSMTGRSAPGSTCISTVGVGIANGAIFDANAAGSCLTAAKAEVTKGTFCPAADAGVPVASTTDPLAICSNVFTASNATRNLGESCSIDSDCIPAKSGRTSCNVTILADGGSLNTCLQVLPGMQSSAPCIDVTGNTGASSEPPLTAYSCAQSAGLYCEDSNHLCKPLKTTGVMCQDDSECVTGDYCNYETTECAPRLANGVACPDGNGCIAGDYCDMTSMKCTALLANGTASSDPTECASTITSNGDCASYADFVLNAYCH